MQKRITYHDGFFRGLRINHESLPVSGCSLDFLAYLHARTERRAATRLPLDPNLQRLLTHYRECFAVRQAA